MESFLDTTTSRTSQDTLGNDSLISLQKELINQNQLIQINQQVISLIKSLSHLLDEQEKIQQKGSILKNLQLAGDYVLRIWRNQIPQRKVPKKTQTRLMKELLLGGIRDTASQDMENQIKILNQKFKENIRKQRSVANKLTEAQNKIKASISQIKLLTKMQQIYRQKQKQQKIQYLKENIKKAAKKSYKFSFGTEKKECAGKKNQYFKTLLRWQMAAPRPRRSNSFSSFAPYLPTPKFRNHSPANPFECLPSDSPLLNMFGY